MNKKNNIKRIKRGSRRQCERKLTYYTSYHAWQAAANFYIQEEQFVIPYKCPVCELFHNTSSAGTGNLSHIPEHLRPLFSTIHNEVNEKPTFWKKLRCFLGVSKYETKK